MKKGLLLSLFTVFLLISCGKKKVYEKHISIDNYKWKRDQVIDFQVEIKDTASLYDVFIAIRHTSYYPYANIRLNVSVTYPEGNFRTNDYNFFLRDEKDGTFKGEGAGDIWDINFPVFEGVNFSEPGIYTFDIQNVMPYIATDDIMEVGLVVRKTDIRK